MAKILDLINETLGVYSKHNRTPPKRCYMHPTVRKQFNEENGYDIITIGTTAIVENAEIPKDKILFADD